MTPELLELRRLAASVPPKARVELGAAPDPERAQRLLEAVATSDHAEQLRAALVLAGARALVHPLSALVLGV